MNAVIALRSLIVAVDDDLSCFVNFSQALHKMPATEQIRRGGRTVPAAEENLLKWSDVQNVLRLDRNGFRGRDIARIADADEAFNRRSCLPVWKSGENVVKTLQESDIVVVSAATGSGKSTQ